MMGLVGCCRNLLVAREARVVILMLRMRRLSYQFLCCSSCARLRSGAPPPPQLWRPCPPGSGFCRVVGRLDCDTDRMARLIRVLLGLTLAVAVAAASAPTAAATQRWSWPLPAPHPVVRPFIAPETAYSSGHRGIDIGGVDGSAVMAPADGVVHFAGWVVDRPVVSIRHAGGLISSFEPVAASVSEGEPVARGQAIGVLEVGHCAMSCLHFGVRLYGEYVSPLLLLEGIPRSVLLPTRELG